MSEPGKQVTIVIGNQTITIHQITDEEIAERKTTLLNEAARIRHESAERLAAIEQEIEILEREQSNRLLAVRVKTVIGEIRDALTAHGRPMNAQEIVDWLSKTRKHSYSFDLIAWAKALRASEFVFDETTNMVQLAESQDTTGSQGVTSDE